MSEPLGLRHPLLKTIRKGTPEGLCVSEGFHLLDEALRAQCEITAIVVAQSVRAAVESRDPRAPVYHVPDQDFNGLASTENSQGVLTLVRPPVWTPEQLFPANALVVVLNGVQDPGNAGTIIRSAEAFGASGILAIKGTVNLHNPKCVRASAGSLFRVPYLQAWEENAAAAALAEYRITSYSTVPTGGESLYQADLTGPTAFIIGNEGRGVSEGLRKSSRDLVIPTTAVESLNAGIAASILLYEASRQRSLGR